LKKVKGWFEFTSEPGWDDDLTLNSNGPVDLTWASRDVLMSLPGMSEPLVDYFLQVRRGPDGLENTVDDTQFKSLEEIRTILRLSQEQFAVLSPLVGFKDPIFRIVSTGKSGETTRVIQMVIRRVGNSAAMITWKEI
jgi:hypothetical protein